MGFAILIKHSPLWEAEKRAIIFFEILGKIISELKGSDITIVSGGAFGVDTCAHKAALKNNLKTIAAIGSGFDFPYPKDNKKLFEEIADNNWRGK
ncbi:MAG: DNA-protecting protein DprA [Desulfobacterales bacterium]|nr:DNA-protecting protein DprA [Desulfobacterales bacterium]